MGKLAPLRDRLPFFPAVSLKNLKVLGILKEQNASEKRIPVTPTVVSKLRKLGFDVLLVNLQLPSSLP